MKFKSAFAILLVMSMTISTLPMMNDMEVEGVDGNFGGGTGSVSDPFIIEDVWDLQEMNKNLSANYTLSNDIDASETATWNDGAGFLPIGERYYHMDGWSEKPFTGSLDGGDHKISGIFIYHEHKDLLRTLPSIGLHIPRKSNRHDCCWGVDRNQFGNCFELSLRCGSGGYGRDW